METCNHVLCDCDKPHAGPASLDIRHVIDLSLNVLVGRDYDITYTPSAQIMLTYINLACCSGWWPWSAWHG